MVGASDLATAPAAGVHVFPSRLPVAAGRMIGLEWPGGGGSVIGIPGNFSGDGGTVLVVARGSDVPAPGDSSTVVNPPLGIWNPGVALFLQATVEPDADGDGYGDTTQDACPADPARQSCPPATPPADAPPGGSADTGAAPVTLPVADVRAGGPTLRRVRWVVSGGRVVITATGARGASHSLMARMGTTRRRARCATAGTAVRCVVRLAPGQWRITVTPVRTGVTGTPAMRTVRIRR